MKLPRMRRAMVAAAIAVSAFGAALSVSPAAHAAPAASRPVLIDCTPKGLIKPRTFIITCADGNDYVAFLRWAHWGSAAGGKGTEFINNCNPNCASGHFHKFGVKVYLWRPRPRPHHPGQRYFTRMTLTYTASVPHGFGRHRTIDLWSRP